jgi:hypothetical protein
MRVFGHERGRRGDHGRNGTHKRHPDRSERRSDDGGGGGGGGAIITRVREGASGALQSVMQSAQSVTEQIKETTGEVTGAVFDTLLDEADRIYRKQKKPAISRIDSLSKMADRAAHALHAVKADGVADYVEQAAEQVGTITDYLQDRRLDEILEDAGEIVQKNKAAALGVLFLAGFAAARFLKATESRDEDDDADDEDDDGGDEKPRRNKKGSKRRGR